MKERRAAEISNNAEGDRDFDSEDSENISTKDESTVNQDIETEEQFF
jgi:hypothetical protein